MTPTICEKCGAPATAIRSEVKALRGYGVVQQAATIEHQYCAAHASAFDARAMAEAKLRGITPPPPSSLVSGAHSDDPGHSDDPDDDVRTEMFERHMANVEREVSEYNANVRPIALAPAEREFAEYIPPPPEWPDWNRSPPIDREEEAREMQRRNTPHPDPYALLGPPGTTSHAAFSSQPDRLALDDQPSREVMPTWDAILGICYLAAQIGPGDVAALLREYERTRAEMPQRDPEGYAEVAANVRAHHEIARAFWRLRQAIDKHMIGDAV